MLAGARRLEKHALGRLVSLVERDGDAARARRAALFCELGRGGSPTGHVIGVTGTPGSGKSTLIGRVALHLLEHDPAVRIAILAIDPSSLESGGALLGDRLRTQFPPGEPRIFFRSQATQGDLGGVGRRTFAVTRLLRHLFDLVFVETVGIGQSEIEIRQLADRIVLVMQPLAGDQIQFMKAGVMEIPDVFIVNKCDEAGLARRSARDLKVSLGYARLGGTARVEQPIFQTSATTGRGIPELADFLHEATRRAPDRPGLRARERYFLRKAVAERYGRFGVEELERVSREWRPEWEERVTYEEREEAALRAIAGRVR